MLGVYTYEGITESCKRLGISMQYLKHWIRFLPVFIPKNVIDL
jgi:hypothetical protein